MTIKNLRYQPAKSVREAVALASGDWGKAAVMAGGTDLLGALKDGVHPGHPELLVDLKSVPGLSHIKESGKGLAIGAMTTLAEVAGHKTIREKYPLLAEAARSVASPQVRNMGTIGGNICQEPRCWYYRSPGNFFHCLRKGGDKCGAIFGENRYHSIFGAARTESTPCASNCPNSTEISAVMAAARQGDFDLAAEVLMRVNPMPAVTGRICPHACETHCSRNELDEPVSVREVERFVGDHALENPGRHYKAPKASGPKRAAVIGSGPAGLSAAYFLRKAGHRVTVYDRMPAPGGMLTYGIPSYRLPKTVVAGVVLALEKMGVDLQLNTDVGRKGLSFEGLRKKNDAVFLSTGTWRRKKLGLEKEELLASGLQFLADARRGVQAGGAPVLDALGKGVGGRRGVASCEGRRVLVIGGGNVAVDVAVSAMRLGASSVTMACLESRGEMPAFPEDIEGALSEKVELLTSWGPSRIIEKNGVLKGVGLIRCTSVFDVLGRFHPTFDPALTKTVEADEVFLAIGQSAELAYAGKSLKLGRGLVQVDQSTGATSLRGVFAGGDAATGPASVVAALAAGRKAAASMDAYLSGGRKKAAPKTRRTGGCMLTPNEDALCGSGRAAAPEVSVSERKIDREDRPTLDAEAVRKEARRCANCGCVAVNASDIAPALVALGGRVKTTRRTLKAEDFFSVQPMKTTALDPDELVTEVFIPAPKPGARQSFLKFRLRNSIDFPIVSVASVLGRRGERLTDASVVLGAVAPTPLRAREVEAYLKGKTPDEAAAVEAGNLAVQDAKPLARNKYKAQLVKALLRKAVLGVRD